MRKMTGQEFDERVQFFDQMALSSWMVKLHEKLVSMTATWTNKEVLDVGCGTGRLLLKGATPSTQMTGIDLSQEMIEKARAVFSKTDLRNDQYEFLVGDAEKLSFR